tara:strand:+ start:1591 stop:2715 length:1125 start_codon:yes stop_codon:yes gene_type:complete
MKNVTPVEKTCKICMNAMVGNEEHVIIRMLESCYQHIDYYVIQCNGSDNTKTIIDDFFKSKGVDGFTYEHEWDFPGVNRDHTLQKALEADHGCDWILRMDADEQLQVDDNFDWSQLNDTSIQSYNITASGSGSIYFRTWLWNATIPWKFEHDRRHECIYIDGIGDQFQRVSLDQGFRHIITNDGVTWNDPNKFLVDAVELEKSKVATGTLLDDPYHFWYIAKSYYDATSGNYPLGKEHIKEYARRSIFYFTNYLNFAHNYNELGQADGINELAYFAMFGMGDLFRICGEYENAIDCSVRAEEFCPARNEHIVVLARCYDELEDYESMKVQTERLLDPSRKLPFPEYNFLLNTEYYIDSGDYGKHLHEIAIKNYK